jgi:hypothetical protein
LAGKRLEPRNSSQLSRVAALWDPQNAGSAQQWKESQLPARELGLQLHSVEVSSAEKFTAAFKDAAKANSGAIILMESQFFIPIKIKNSSPTSRQKIAYPRFTLGQILSRAAV